MQTQKRNGHQLNAKAIKQSQKRNRPLNASAIKQTQKINGPLKETLLGEPECARLAKRVRYGKAKRSTVQNQRGHRKSTTDKVIQRYVNVVTFSYLRYYA